MDIGIVIDRNKLPVYSRHLWKAGFAFREHGRLALSVASLTITLDAQDCKRLKEVLRAAGQEAGGISPLNRSVKNGNS